MGDSPLIQEGVELKQEVSDGEVNTDKARVQQMVINLLSNAIKFTDSGSVTAKAEQADGQLVVSVTDTGKGTLRRTADAVRRISSGGRV